MTLEYIILTWITWRGGRRRGLIESRKGRKRHKSRGNVIRGKLQVWVEGCWQKYDLHVSDVELMNMDADCMHLIF